MQRCLNGSQEAFGILVKRYQAYVFAVILHVIHAPQDTESIAQEVFLQIYRSLDQYHSTNFKGWIGKIAAAKAIDWQRAQRRQAHEQLMPGDEAQFGYAVSQRYTPEETVLIREDRQRVQAVCTTLPAIYRDVILRFYFEGKTYQEIAHEDNTSVKTVESRLYRARHLFRERWEEGSA